jgi:hypothetical protein
LRGNAGRDERDPLQPAPMVKNYAESEAFPPIKIDLARNSADGIVHIMRAPGRGMIADSAELLNAERRLGEMLVEAKAAGQIRAARPSKKSLPDRKAFRAPCWPTPISAASCLCRRSTWPAA